MRREEPAVETEELSERVLKIISGYGMGAPLSADDLLANTAPPPTAILVPGEPPGHAFMARAASATRSQRHRP